MKLLLRVLAILAVVALLASPAVAQYQKSLGWCGVGGVQVPVAGTPGSTLSFQQSAPSCTVTVYDTGTVNLSTLYANATGTAKANPFTAASNGLWFFYASSSARYDVVMSGGGLTAPVTLADLSVGALGEPFDVRNFVSIQAAVTAAVTAGAGHVIIPCGTYALPTELNIDTSTGAQLELSGAGACTILEPTGATNKAVHVVGTAGITAAQVYLHDFAITAATSGTSTVGLHLDGIAHFAVENVWVSGAGKMTNCIQLTGSQQGYILGGMTQGCAVGALLEQSSGGVKSNGVLWHGMTFVGNTATNLKIDAAGAGGVDDLWFDGNHLTAAAMQIDIGGTGSGLVTIRDNHLEPLAGNNGMIVRNGRVVIAGNSFYGVAGTTDVNIAAGSDGAIVDSNLIDANVVVASGAVSTSLTNNFLGGSVTDAGTYTRVFNNYSFSGTGIARDLMVNATTLTATNMAAGGDIMRFLPDPGVNGPWGIKVDGTGANTDVYVQLHDVTLNGNTNGSVLTIRSGVAGTLWETFNAGGMVLPVGSAVTADGLTSNATTNLTLYGSTGHTTSLGANGTAALVTLTAGNFTPATDNTIDFGTGATRWKSLAVAAITNTTGVQMLNSTTTCTTGASVGATCTTAAITLPVAYADTNYRLTCTGLTPTNVPIVQTVAKSNTTFTITVAALTAAAATFTSFDCVATHN